MSKKQKATPEEKTTGQIAAKVIIGSILVSVTWAGAASAGQSHPIIAGITGVGVWLVVTEIKDKSIARTIFAATMIAIAVLVAIFAGSAGTRTALVIFIISLVFLLIQQRGLLFQTIHSKMSAS